MLQAAPEYLPCSDGSLAGSAGSHGKLLPVDASFSVLLLYDVRSIFLGLFVSLLLLGCSSRPRNKPDRKLVFNTNAPSRSVRSPVQPRGDVVSSGQRVNRSLFDVTRLWGRVASVNEKLRFTVLDFSLARMPENHQELSVYRGGQKIGAVRVSGSSFDNHIAADIVRGTLQIGDEVRPE